MRLAGCRRGAKNAGMFSLLSTARPVPAPRQADGRSATPTAARHVPSSAATAIRLGAGGVMPLPGGGGGGAGNRIACVSGTLWVTQEGDAHDYVLKAGDHFRAGGRGRVVVQALSDATLEVSWRQA